jgi:hypothetical protein
MNWLLHDGEVQGDIRWDEVAHEDIEYRFEEQLKGEVRELRIKMDRDVVAATTYVRGEIPEGWDEDYFGDQKPSYQANDIDWFSMGPEFEDCEDALDIYREMKDF